MGAFEYLQHKLSSAIGGLLGGTSALRFMAIKNPEDAFYRGALSVIFSVVFGTPLLMWLGLPYANWEWQIASGFICGFIGYSAMMAAGNYMEKNKAKDIVEVATELIHIKKKSPKQKKAKKK